MSEQEVFQNIKLLAEHLNVELIDVNVTWPDGKKSVIFAAAGELEFFIEMHRKEFPRCKYDIDK